MGDTEPWIKPPSPLPPTPHPRAAAYWPPGCGLATVPTLCLGMQVRAAGQQEGTSRDMVVKGLAHPLICHGA